MAPIYYRVDGHGPTVILAHGWAASHHDWDKIFPHLVKAGYRVYALDQLGHGQSEKPSEAYAYQLDQLYGAFCQWVDNLALALPFALVGHSMGGYISLRYTLENPERVTALGLVDPLYAPEQLTFLAHQILCQPALLEKVLRHTPEQLPYPLNEIVPPATRHTLQDYSQASPYIAYTLAAIPSLDGKLNCISQPTMLLYGSADLSLQPSSFQNLHQQLPHVVDFLRISGAGHTPHITHANLVNRHILDFLDNFAKAWIGPNQLELNRMALDF